MLVRDVGEAGLIKLFSAVLGAEPEDQSSTRHFPLRIGIGDDAAAWEGPVATTVTTADALVEGVHFTLENIDWQDLGWKSLAVNLSDIAAMGCMPLYSTVTLGVRSDLPIHGIEAIYRGMAKASREFNGQVVGGDVVRSPVIFIAVAMYGTALPIETGNDPVTKSLLTRSAAAIGDLIAVTGTLGCSTGGFQLLNHQIPEHLSADEAAHLVQAHNRPIPRVSSGIHLVRKGVKAAIDVSDGLATDLSKLCESSGVSAVIRADKVPIDDHLKQAFPHQWRDLALTGGEDYELLFTAPPKLLTELQSNLEVQTTIIGEIKNGPPKVTFLDTNDAPITIGHTSWDHFGRDK